MGWAAGLAKAIGPMLAKGVGGAAKGVGNLGQGVGQGFMGQSPSALQQLPQGIQGPLQQTPVSQNIGRLIGQRAASRIGAPQQRGFLPQQPALQQGLPQGMDPVAAGERAADLLLAKFEQSVERARRRKVGTSK
jgi:hypothetical protein